MCDLSIVIKSCLTTCLLLLAHFSSKFTNICRDIFIVLCYGVLSWGKVHVVIGFELSVVGYKEIIRLIQESTNYLSPHTLWVLRRLAKKPHHFFKVWVMEMGKLKQNYFTT